MADLLIFTLGAIVTLATVIAVLLVGRSEGRDPALSKTRRTGPVEPADLAPSR